MFGWRARIGVLVPPGNPTVEPEFYLLAPEGVTIHFARLQGFQSASAPGAAAGMDARTLAYLDELPGPAKALGSVSPDVVILAHMASSYATGFVNELQLIDRLAGHQRFWKLAERNLGRWPDEPIDGHSGFALQE